MYSTPSMLLLIGELEGRGFQVLMKFCASIFTLFTLNYLLKFLQFLKTLVSLFLKVRRGAQPKVHRKYTRGSLRGRGEVIKKVSNYISKCKE
jgi:hypothetical protein